MSRVEIVISWDELLRDARQLALQLHAAYAPHHDGHLFKGIIAIARGGLIPAAIIARELDIRWITTMCVAGYEGQDQQTELEVIKPPNADVFQDGGKGYLVVDDLVDTGKTAHVVRRYFPKAVYATLYTKQVAKSDAWIRQFYQGDWIHFPWDVEHKFSKPIRGEG